MTPHQKAREDDAQPATAPLDDAHAEWPRPAQIACEPDVFETSTTVEPIFFETSTTVVLGEDGQRLGAGPLMWEAYRRYGYSVWRFDGLAWQVVAERCRSGACCGAPPSDPGQYVGEHRKKQCEPAAVLEARPVGPGAPE
jgi:hypothetical protein